MAYIIPSGGSVAFIFSDSGYSTPGGANVNFIFVDTLSVEDFTFGYSYAVPQLFDVNSELLTASWVVEIFPLFELTHAWATEATSAEDAFYDAAYAVAAPQDLGELPLNLVWEVEEVPVITLEHASYWSVDPVFSVTQLLTNRWETVNAPAFDFLFNAVWFLSPGVESETIILYNQEVAVGTEIVYTLGAEEIAQEVELTSPLLLDVAAEDVLDSNMGIVANETEIVSRITNDAQNETIIDSPMLQDVAAETIISGAIKVTDTVQVKDSILYSILGDAVVQIDVVPTLTIAGETFSVEEAEVSFDEGQFAWTCRVGLRDPAHFDLLEANDEFTLDIFGESFVFILDSKEFSRSSPTSIRATISGISPSALFAAPRAEKITKTWETATFAASVAQELFGGAVSWEILNWSIPAFRLAVSNQTPIEILQLLAQAAGATVVSEPDGAIRVRYLYPISVPVYPLSVPDQDYSDVEHNFYARENFPHFDLVNKLRILDVPRDAFADTVEFEKDELDFTRGKLKVFPSPWRTTIEMDHTSRFPVSVTKVGVETEQIEETVEVLHGEGSTSKPIFQLQSLEWLYEDLLGIAFSPDSKNFKSTHPTKTESLLKITYLTRYVRFNCAAFNEAEVQFLVKDPENV